MIKSIAKGKALSREQWDILTKEFAGKDVPFHIDRVKKFSIYGFFPKGFRETYFGTK